MNHNFEEFIQLNTKVRRLLLAWIIMAFIGAVYICYGKGDEIIFGLRTSICQLRQFAVLPCCSTQARQTEHFRSWLLCLKASFEDVNQTSEIKKLRLYSYWERFNPPPFHNWPDYYQNKSAVDSNQLSLPTSPRKCSIRAADRDRNYRLLLFWMQLAKKHQIVWWITYGTLLGSYRHQDFIPYDHDIDVNMLEEYEPVLNQIRTPRKDFDPKYINIITRERDHCKRGLGNRTNSKGKTVRKEFDRFKFCPPSARLLATNEGIFDVFVFHVNETLDKYEFEEPVGMSIRNYAVYYPLRLVFPLATCKFMGLDVPCPRKPEAFLEIMYGTEFKKPDKVCDTLSGRWVLRKKF